MSLIGTSALLLLIITFIAACGQDISADAFFITGKRPGLSGASSHKHKHIHKLSALRAFHLRQSWGVLSFMATVQQCTHNKPPLYPILFKIYAAIAFKRDPLLFQQPSLRFATAKGKMRGNLTLTVYNTVAREATRAGVIMKDIAHCS